MTPDEFKEKRPISLGFVIWVGILCFSLGGFTVGITGLKGMIVDEVSGLRADWERNNKIVNEKFKSLNSRMDRKIKNHELIHHK